ncbi:MAG: DNRLRE domain-containing protein, partial [Candidatus Hodarchaeales archaeon]
MNRNSSIYKRIIIVRNSLIHKKWILLVIFGLSLINFTFPLINKPATSANQNVFASVDTYINNFNPLTSYGSFPYVAAGFQMPEAAMLQTLLYFDISVCSDMIISYATLHIFVTDLFNFPVPLNVHIVVEPWDETTTWMTQPMYDPAFNNSFLGDIGPQFVDLTQIAQDWADGDLANFGILLENDIVTDYIHISSREAPSNQPYLEMGCEEPPTIDQPADFSYIEGETGNNISWTGTDDNPDTYTVTRNGTGVGSDVWTSGVPINISVDGLSPGVYYY